MESPRMKSKAFAAAQQMKFLLISIAKDTWTFISEAQLMLVASAMAYTTIISIVPALAVSFAIFQAFGGLGKLYQVIEPLILQNLAEGSSDEAIAAIRGSIGKIHAGALGAGGFVGLIFTTMALLASGERAINRVWKTEIQRGWFQRISYYWLFITLGPLAVAVALGYASSLDYPIVRLFPTGSGIFALTVSIFFLIYKYVPNRPVGGGPALVSAFFTAIVWNLARKGFAVYTTNLVSYNKIYGSLGAIPIFLLWLYVIWLIVLTGAALTAALQKRIKFE